MLVERKFGLKNPDWEVERVTGAETGLEVRRRGGTEERDVKGRGRR
jgi:hypothetical protein